MLAAGADAWPGGRLAELAGHFPEAIVGQVDVALPVLAVDVATEALGDQALPSTACGLDVTSQIHTGGIEPPRLALEVLGQFDDVRRRCRS